MTDIINVAQIEKMLADFSAAREWDKFHSPKNLAMAIAGEAGELLEIFQWLTEQESFDIKNDPEVKEKVGHELADIILYVIRMAYQLNIPLNKALLDKIALNNMKYPAEKVKGSAKKYTDYVSNNT